ncbi:MAG: hypothetical protein WBO70_06390 [Erysipelotrichaceae bacterium]
MDIQKIKDRVGYKGKSQQWQYGFDLAVRGLQQSQKVAVPDGYVVVPREPTKTMLIAADNCEIDGKVTAHNIYKAMIEAQEN